MCIIQFAHFWQFSATLSDQIQGFGQSMSELQLFLLLFFLFLLIVMRNNVSLLLSTSLLFKIFLINQTRLGSLLKKTPSELAPVVFKWSIHCKVRV